MTPLFVGLALVVAAPVTKEPPKKVAPALVGHWSVESSVKGGQPSNSPPGATMEFTVDGRIVLHEAGKDITGTYKTDPKKDPPEVDLNLDAGGTQVTMPGIFKIEKETLQICLTFMGDRPTAFTTPEGAKTVLLTLKRAKKD